MEGLRRIVENTELNAITKKELNETKQKIMAALDTKVDVQEV